MTLLRSQSFQEHGLHTTEYGELMCFITNLRFLEAMCQRLLTDTVNCSLCMLTVTKILSVPTVSFHLSGLLIFAGSSPQNLVFNESCFTRGVMRCVSQPSRVKMQKRGGAHRAPLPRKTSCITWVALQR